MPIPTTATTAWATMVLDTGATDTVLATTARGLLMLSQLPLLRPRLMPIPTTDTTAMDTDTVLDMPVTDTVLATTDTAVVCTDTTDKCPADSSHRKTSLGITSSSSEKMDRSVWFDPHQCYQFQCHQASPS